MSRYRYDVMLGFDRATLEPHFCREINADGEGCFGTDPTHGLSFDGAKDELATWHEQQAAYWRKMTEEEFLEP